MNIYMYDKSLLLSLFASQNSLYHLKTIIERVIAFIIILNFECYPVNSGFLNPRLIPIPSFPQVLCTIIFYKV